MHFLHKKKRKFMNLSAENIFVDKHTYVCIDKYVKRHLRTFAKLLITCSPNIHIHINTCHFKYIRIQVQQMFVCICM